MRNFLFPFITVITLATFAFISMRIGLNAGGFVVVAMAITSLSAISISKQVRRKKSFIGAIESNGTASENTSVMLEQKHA